MFLFDPREPISTWTHALGAIVALPVTIWLWRLCIGDQTRRLSFAVFGAGLFGCYTASTMYHGVQGSGNEIAFFITVDRVGIFGLIAATYTPILCVVFRGGARALSLAFVWGYATLCIWLYVKFGTPRAFINTALYLGMGWGGLLFYFEAERRLTRRAMLPLVIGGLCYSIGAIINFVGWPNPVDNVFGNHEIFHLFVMAGTASHIYFMARVIAPFRGTTRRRPNVRTRIGSGPLLDLSLLAVPQRKPGES
jgi:hemolysin III